MNVNHRAVDAIPDAPEEAWDAARDLVTEHAPDLAPMILGDDDRRGLGHMKADKRRRAIARHEIAKVALP